jgi:hypothetical protein
MYHTIAVIEETQIDVWGTYAPIITMQRHASVDPITISWCSANSNFKLGLII